MFGHFHSLFCVSHSPSPQSPFSCTFPRTTHV
ncbi:hypothetical protein Zm00014a_040996 [Zea mays]|uniref:Uncharacterized protein n=1 Tax=Zea mays TaxID=4577 RepID=A0A3L6G575_MAIZE|nr:hypothetical protein Zm00014a_040996 [Zea mays]